MNRANLLAQLQKSWDTVQNLYTKQNAMICKTNKDILFTIVKKTYAMVKRENVPF